MAKRDMNDLLKRRMSATQQAAEVTVGDEAYEVLFQGKLSSFDSKFCNLPLDRLRPFFTADIGFHPYPPEKLKAFSQQLAERGIYERIIVRPIPESEDYAAKSYTVSEVKTIGRLDRNDMSYVPSATVKNGRTLSLADVEWQVTGTDLVGETLVPSSYQAVATYSARVPYQAATGYITTAEYTGEITREGVESITYVLTYLGTKVGIAHVLSNVGGFFAANWLVLVVGAAMGAAVIFGIVYASYVHRQRAARAEADNDGASFSEEETE